MISMKKIVPIAAGMTLVASLSSFAVLNASPANANDNHNRTSRYQSDLKPLNDSGVNGKARLSLQGTDLQVKVNASGLVPNKPHVAHIHGSLTGADAMCPSTVGDDANSDGFLSVFEGAPKYGPIKMNLTQPQTPFGPSPTPALFAPFAGTPDNAQFPQVGDNGKFKLNQTYSFNLGNAADKEAFQSIKQLDKQHIVIHGDFAPENVDTAGGGSQVVYDPLLPVACGEIKVTGNGNGPENVEMNMTSAKPGNSTRN